jgi:membrane associated rhomboid family serine protease
MFMQLLFGLPLNMVHGSLKFGLIYELGVMFGALTFITVDGGYDSVVGCSGGVYCIFGMHLAEIVTNWSLENRGLMNHWTRLLIMSIVLGADAYK